MAKKGKRPSSRHSKDNSNRQPARLMTKEPKIANQRLGKVSSKQKPSNSDRPLSVVGVGASAGGLEAFEQLLRAVPRDTGLAFVLVQHLAPKHESMLSQLLAKATKMPVIEVTDGRRVEANHVYVIPPDADMSISDGLLHLSPLRADRGFRMPIDWFFRSLASDYQSRAVGVILSGTASDGTLGLQAIKAMGGVTLAQDEESAKYSAMPRSAVAAGNVDFVLAPEGIASELKRIGTHVQLFGSDDKPDAETPITADETLNKIFLVLRNFSRVDFSHYKPGTIKRRISRRMFLQKIDSLEGYLQFLRNHRDEVEALFNDILINVTSFFRDPDCFESLKSIAFPRILGNKPPHVPIRFWVPGCSTGEEAYSLAIALLEFLGDEKTSNFQMQIFATDLSDGIINKARVGIYPESIAMDVNSARLRRFFGKVEGGYQINKNIRDMVVFAKQDLAKDPPFSKLDLISCRNVMIYMAQVLQKKILPLFQFALNPGGILFLGSAETVGGFADLFEPLDKKHKVYAKKSIHGHIALDFMPRFHAEHDHRTPSDGAKSPDLLKVGEQMLLYRYSPASVIVNEHLEIVQFIGQTGPFLDPLPGDASLNLLRMVKTGLHLELRVAFQKAKRNRTVRKDGVLIEHEGTLKTVNFEITPVKDLPDGERYYLLVFEEANRPAIEVSKKDKKRVPEKQIEKKQSSSLDVDTKRLREELEATREYLQSIIEEQRTTNEELRSANEEIQSSNEELQSINEELETAKEELQSTNEELTTVNEELQNRNDELSKVNSDLSNLLSSVNIPIIMLGNDLRIRRFTPMAEKVMNLIPGDIGRPITDIKANVKTPDLKQAVQRVIDSLEIQEFRVEDHDGRWYSMRIRPYRTIDNKIDGVVIVLLDMETRRAHQA